MYMKDSRVMRVLWLFSQGHHNLQCCSTSSDEQYVGYDRAVDSICLTSFQPCHCSNVLYIELIVDIHCTCASAWHCICTGLTAVAIFVSLISIFVSSLQSLLSCLSEAST